MIPVEKATRVILVRKETGVIPVPQEATDQKETPVRKVQKGTKEMRELGVRKVSQAPVEVVRRPREVPRSERRQGRYGGPGSERCQTEGFGRSEGTQERDWITRSEGRYGSERTQRFFFCDR